GTRAAETTLGTWVGDAVKHAAEQANPEVDLGVTNPGGLRSELLTDRFTDGGAFPAKPADLVGRLTLGELLDMPPFG
ncbi:bifunctional metallophosphatase/5'-nucleotidase, partial [Xanthomonas citri pv. citri]|nr:bifunctional metallophosphatase/5'-nucleotidase [Xanthomonas citri pv. citri]